MNDAPLFFLLYFLTLYHSFFLSFYLVWNITSIYFLFCSKRTYTKQNKRFKMGQICLQPHFKTANLLEKMKLTSVYRLGIRLAIIAANGYILSLYHHDNEIA